MPIATSFIIIPAAISLAGATTRLVLQHVIQTRYQIMTFWIVAGIVEIGAARAGLPPSWRRFLVSVLSVSIAITAVRVYLEGLPQPLEAIKQMRHPHDPRG